MGRVEAPGKTALLVTRELPCYSARLTGTDGGLTFYLIMLHYNYLFSTVTLHCNYIFSLVMAFLVFMEIVGSVIHYFPLVLGSLLVFILQMFKEGPRHLDHTWLILVRLGCI